VASALFAGCAGGGAGGRAPAPVLDLSEFAPAAETYTDEDLAHLRFVLDEESTARYELLSPAGREEFLRVVWAELDPTPTTPLNERREEHYRRLAYARAHFGIEEDPGWDRRGELLLRYGVPDQRQVSMADVVDEVGLIPPRELWIYAGLGQAYRLEDPRLQNHFLDSYELTGRNKMPSPRSLGGRVDPEATASRPKPPPLPAVGDAEAALLSQKLETMLATGQEAYRVRPQSYRHDYGGAELPFVFDVVNFASGAAGKTDIQVNTAFWATDLGYRPERDGFVAVLETDAVVKTMEWEDVTWARRTARDRKESTGNLTGRLVLDQLNMQVEPGHYRLAISARDSLSGNLGIFKTEFWVRPFPEGELRLSDIQRALEVRRARPEDPFQRGAFHVAPYPLGTFPGDRNMFFFFEIYGLRPSPDGEYLYAVDVLVEPREGEPPSWFGSSKGRVVPGVGFTFEGTARTSPVGEDIIFDPSNFKDGTYDLTLTVHDRTDGRTSGGSTSFAVKRP
jgi:GWxTD domain-containing protein